MKTEDLYEQGNMKRLFIYTVLLFSMLYATTLGSATTDKKKSRVWIYKTISQEKNEQLKCLATNIYFEARNEPFAGKLAVAMVTLNRVESRTFPNTLCDVVYDGIHWKSGHPKRDRCQFSWYCDGQSDKVVNKRAYRSSEHVALLAIEGYHTIRDKGLDITEGAKFYHHHEISPWWSNVKGKVGRIGEHIFYK